MGADVPAEMQNSRRWYGGASVSPMIAELEDVGKRSSVFDVLEEHFDQIAARCLDTSNGRGSQILAVSSAVAGEGTTTVGIGIAAAAGRLLGRDVLLVETGLSKGVLARDFKVDAVPGLSDYLSGQADLEQIIRRTHMGNTWLLPGGSPTPNPGPLFRSGRLTELFPALRGLFAAVILDVPPLLNSPHAPLLTRFADGLVITCHAGSTHSEDVRRAIEAAGQVEVRGLILNRTRRWVPRWVSKIAGISRTSLVD